MFFCTIGNKSLIASDLFQLNNHAFVFAAASGHDQIEDSANFMRGEMAGPFIMLVHAERTFALSGLS